MIVLRKAVSTLTVKIGSRLLAESPALRASKHLPNLWLTVIAENTRAQRTTIHAEVSSRRAG